MPKNVRSRRKDASEPVYCRKCMQLKGSNNFYTAVDKLLDSNGYMSVCKDCCNDVFNANFASTKNLRVAILNTCRALNIAFSENAVNGVQSRIEKLTKFPTNVWGFYKQALAGSGNVQGADFNVMTFVEPMSSQENVVSQHDYDDSGDVDAMKYFEQEWGMGLELSDYEWLEAKFEKWKSTHKCDTTAEEGLLKRIVWNEFDTMKARLNGDPTTNLDKQYESLIKTANVDPQKASSGSKSQETFSNFIKMIEENEPAEVYGEERDAFKDWQNIGWYFKNYVVRAIKNFMTGSRDFNIEALTEDSEEDEIFDSPDGLLKYMGNEDGVN